MTFTDSKRKNECIDFTMMLFFLFFSMCTWVENSLGSLTSNLVSDSKFDIVVNVLASHFSIFFFIFLKKQRQNTKIYGKSVFD